MDEMARMKAAHAAELATRDALIAKLRAIHAELNDENAELRRSITILEKRIIELERRLGLNSTNNEDSSLSDWLSDLPATERNDSLQNEPSSSRNPDVQEVNVDRNKAARKKEHKLNTLIANGIESIFHVAPLHYLPYIARSQSLKSKATLLREGFSETHFRRTSRRQDTQRGFGEYIHLSTDSCPPILKLKLLRGFPHIVLVVPATALNNLAFDLCRYNVAKTRQLRRDGKPGYDEGPANGWYHDRCQIPIARYEEEQNQLIQSRCGEMLEVLCKPEIALPNDTRVFVFDKDDCDTARMILAELNVSWAVSRLSKPDYQVHTQYSVKCRRFIECLLKDENWKGNGLDFDPM